MSAISTKSPEDLIMRRLYAPFPVKSHEWHPYFGFVYLKEEALNLRLTEVLGPFGWDVVVTERQFVPEGSPTVEMKVGNAKYHVPLDNYPGVWRGEDGKYLDPNNTEIKVVFDIPIVMVHGYMTIRCGAQAATRHSTGGDVLTDLGKERGARLLNTYKSSTTDLFKNLARRHGVGLYLTEAKGVTETNLATWIRSNYGPTSLIEAKQMLVQALKVDTEEARGELRVKINTLGLTDDDLFLYYSESLELIKNG